MLFILPVGRQRAIEAISKAEDGWRVKVEPPKRSLEQNALLHACLTEIADTMTWAGRKWDIEDWKRLLTAAWLRTKKEAPVMLPAIDGAGFDVLYRRTSQLTKAECSELIEFIFAWRAECKGS